MRIIIPSKGRSDIIRDPGTPGFPDAARTNWRCGGEAGEEEGT